MRGEVGFFFISIRYFSSVENSTIEFSSSFELMTFSGHCYLGTERALQTHPAAPFLVLWCQEHSETCLRGAVLVLGEKVRTVGGRGSERATAAAYLPPFLAQPDPAEVRAVTTMGLRKYNS